MINKEFIHVIHLFKYDRLTDQEKFFLSQLFHLKTPIKLNYVNNDFIQILDSIDNKPEFDRLNKEEKYFLIGNSRIGILEANQAKKINQLIDSKPQNIINQSISLSTIKIFITVEIFKL